MQSALPILFSALAYQQHDISRKLALHREFCSLRTKDRAKIIEATNNNRILKNSNDYPKVANLIFYLIDVSIRVTSIVILYACFRQTLPSKALWTFRVISLIPILTKVATGLRDLDNQGEPIYNITLRKILAKLRNQEPRSSVFLFSALIAAGLWSLLSLKFQAPSRMESVLSNESMKAIGAAGYLLILRFGIGIPKDIGDTNLHEKITATFSCLSDETKIREQLKNPAADLIDILKNLRDLRENSEGTLVQERMEVFERTVCSMRLARKIREYDSMLFPLEEAIEQLDPELLNRKQENDPDLLVTYKAQLDLVLKRYASFAEKQYTIFRLMLQKENLSHIDLRKEKQLAQIYHKELSLMKQFTLPLSLILKEKIQSSADRIKIEVMPARDWFYNALNAANIPDSLDKFVNYKNTMHISDKKYHPYISSLDHFGGIFDVFGKLKEVNF